MEKDKTSAASLYDRWSTLRDPYLKRAYDCAEITIPSLLPREGHNGSTRFLTPWQAVGARGVNNLASKLLLSQLPPNTACFRLAIDDFTLEKLTQQEGLRAQVEEGLSKIERSVQSEIEGGFYRVGAFEAQKHLVVAGNVLLYLPPDGGMRVFHLDRYVVRRDPKGDVLDIIVKETVSKDNLPEGVSLEADPETTDKKDRSERNIDLYTHVYRDGNKWKVYQEVKGQMLPGTEGTYPLDKSPWIPIRFSRIDGESYGRSYVEEYLGDLKSLEGLSQAIVEGSAAAAKVVFLVNPNGTTRMDDLATAESGDFREGAANEVSVLQLDKYNDFRVALETITQITERLSFAFLLNSAIQRSGERVTAEEIRYMANELESALGGVYSIQSQEFQLPFIQRIMFQMERQKRLPVLPTGTVKPVIVTGIEALGRGNDLNKLLQFAGLAAQAANLPPEIDKADFLKRAGASLGIDMKGLVLPPEVVAQQQQQAMMMQMAQQLGPNAINAVGGMMKQGMQNGAEAQQAAPQQ